MCRNIQSFARFGDAVLRDVLQCCYEVGKCGCLQDEMHLGYCAICKIRLCCRDRGFDNCAHCSGYICDILQHGFDFMCDPLEIGTPDNLPARDNLEEIRRGLHKKPKSG